MKNILSALSKILITYCLLFLSICFSQETNKSLDELNKLVNYTPTAFIPNNESKPKSRFFDHSFETIGHVQSLYRFQDNLNLTEIEVKWLESQINQLALAFFLEGKPILIRKSGGYSGCEGVEHVEVEIKNGYEVTILNYCFTCSGPNQFEKTFMEIFNNRTEKLIEK